MAASAYLCSAAYFSPRATYCSNVWPPHATAARATSTATTRILSSAQEKRGGRQPYRETAPRPVVSAAARAGSAPPAPPHEERAGDSGAEQEQRGRLRRHRRR